jgi:ribosomal protein S18 acetylase RimI-like enzyme
MNKPDDGIEFRTFATEDSVDDLTELLHRAYADHAAEGRQFFASYQTVEDTRHRLSKGECWLALSSGTIIGTVTLSVPMSIPDGYPAHGNAGTFYQLAIDPAWRGTGLGGHLLGIAERRIEELGASEVVIDTSELASDLISWYERRGYERCGTWKWNVTNYDSVVLHKTMKV